ncbi:MAG: hypothetical protein M3Z21_08295 [Pseudomonadota bacterium]|nr:hypothetical protein [Pseudomonadota bacterium]
MKRRLLLAGGVAATALLLAILYPRLEGLAAASLCRSVFGINAAVLLVAAFLISGVVLTCGLLVYLFFFCRRAVRAGQFPPPGRYFIPPRKFLHGPPAVRRGRIGMAFAAVAAPGLLIYGLYGAGVFVEAFGDVPAELEGCGQGYEKSAM